MEEVRSSDIRRLENLHNFFLCYFSKKNSVCPLDQISLSVEDIFPDNYTKREIEQLRKSYPEQFPCIAPEVFYCKFAALSCDFKTLSKVEIDSHMEDKNKEHLDLMLKSHLKNQYKSWEPTEKSPNSKQGDNNPFFQQQQSTNDLISAMYERIVVLEQQNLEQSYKIENMQSMEQRRHGVLVWRLEDFRQKIDQMQTNPGMMIYSNDCYTDPNGYKFCARINLSQKNKDVGVSLHIHLMKSENDYHLLWPFVGRIKISMIHKDASHSQHDVLMSKPDILAFHRPTQDISPRGFGFIDYAFVNDIYTKGFTDNNVLTLKITMNIV